MDSHLKFFTLYTSIAPAVSRKDSYLALSQLKEEQGTEIPFYEKFKFRVAAGLQETHNCITRDGVKILPRSFCYFECADNEHFNCIFYDDSTGKDTPLANTTKIKLPKNWIEPIPGATRYVDINYPKYGTRIKNTIVYNEDILQADGFTDTDEWLSQNKAATLETFALFLGDLEFKGAGFVKVHVADNNFKGDCLIKFDDLEINTFGMGRIKDDSGIQWNETRNGITVYDSDTGTPNVLGVLAGGAEFELEEPDIFWDNYRRPGHAFAIKRESQTERKRFIKLTRQDDWEKLEAKIVRKEKYNTYETDSEGITGTTVIAGGNTEEFEPLDKNTLLGGQAEQIFAYKNFHDLTLLFDNADFLKDMEPVEWKDYFALLEQVDTSSGGIWHGIQEALRNLADNGGTLRPILTRLVRALEQEWRELKRPEFERADTKQVKRTLVCRHPLEWDKTIYLDGDTVKSRVAWDFNVKDDRRDAFARIIKGTDIWSFLAGKEIDGLDLSRNEFWFAHPVYFADTLHGLGYITEPRIRNLMKVQDEVVGLQCFLGGTAMQNNMGKHRHGRGMYGNTNAPNTYCNHAVYVTVKAVDGNFGDFIGLNSVYYAQEPPWDFGLDRRGVSVLEGEFKEAITVNHRYIYKTSNLWCDILDEQVRRGKLVKLSIEGDHTIGEKRAQEYADMGYAVIGAWKNTETDINKDRSPHYATVRPGFKFDPKNGIMLANVGGINGIIYVSKGFGDTKRTEMNWYYNPNQNFKNEDEKNNGLKGILGYLGYR